MSEVQLYMIISSGNFNLLLVIIGTVDFKNYSFHQMEPWKMVTSSSPLGFKFKYIRTEEGRGGSKANLVMFKILHPADKLKQDPRSVQWISLMMICEFCIPLFKLSGTKSWLINEIHDRWSTLSDITTGYCGPSLLWSLISTTVFAVNLPDNVAFLEGLKCHLPTRQKKYAQNTHPHTPHTTCSN